MTSMTEASSSQAAISGPSAVRSMRALRDDACDWMGMTLMNCPVQTMRPTTGCTYEADQKDIRMGLRNSLLRWA